MAFNAGTYWEVQTGGADTAGGGFDTGVAGFLADWAIASANTSAPVVTSASYNFIAGDVGGWFFLKSGTSSIPGWYIIVSVASNAATLNAAIGQGVLFNSTGTNGTPSTVLGCCTTGTSLSSITGGIDFSQQATAEIAYDDMIVGATTTQFTSVHFPVTKRIIGNIINVVSGATVQRVAVVSTSTITATCDKSLGTAAQVGVGNLGGAFLSPALPVSLVVAGNAILIKSGSYSITSASTNIAGGCISTAITSCRIEGYNTIRGDLGTAPVMTASGISTFTFLITGSDWNVRNLTFDGASLTSSRGFAPNRGIMFKLTAKNCTNNGFSTATSTNALYIQCIATGCSTAVAFVANFCMNCEAYSNTISGFSCTQTGADFWACNSYSNSGASSDGFILANTAIRCVNCIAYANGRDGFRILAQASCNLINCLSESSIGVGYNITGTSCQLFNCGSFGNGTDFTITGANSSNLNSITTASTFFVNAASGNFALNGTATGGALARAAGIPGVAPDGLTTGYLDLGAYQSPPMIPMSRVFSGM